MGTALKNGQTRCPKYNTGAAVVKIYHHMLRDFQTSETAEFMSSASHHLMTDIKAFRALPERDLGFVDVGRFKRTKQMESLVKKFRFDDDAYSDEELTQMGREAYLDDQLRLHQPLPLKSTGFAVLQRARLIAHRILGECPVDEVIEHVQFGRKSSIGCPHALAYIDEKLSMLRAFTGTRETVKFFFGQVLPGDAILRRILKNHKIGTLKEQLNTTYLNLVEVPKTWKAYRLITPLTLIGLFFSYGVGRVVTSRLRDAGLDISTLQQRHRKWVKTFSRTRSHATADLSAASDSITSELLNRILPRPWYRLVRKTFVRHLVIGDQRCSTASVLPMGNGATFPVETLVFYCIIKAIGELTGVKGIYSVYGDDLIYPSKLHKYVVAVFPQLHLKLNLDKTFVNHPFRESCGADYYRGQDVRPYFIKGDSEGLTRVRYEAFLYKVYNGLTLRWDPLEIKGTLTWLLTELAMVSRGILRVPPCFPDYSGIKVADPTDVPLNYKLLPFCPIKIQFNNGSRWFQFDFLLETPKKRVVKTTEPYYWLALQGITDEVIDEHGRFLQLHNGNVFTDIAAASFLLGTKIPRIPPKGSLSWRKTVRKHTKYSNGRKLVQRAVQYHAEVSSKSGGTVSTASTKTESISDWF
jgi:hypothetical protein